MDSNSPNAASKQHHNDQSMPIAICGMGLRLPGGIRSDKDFLDLLVNKRDARQPIPADRFNIDGYYNPSGKAGSIITKHGYFLDVDLAAFDSSMFSMSKAEISQIDPGQRLLLEVTREALETAGEMDFRGKNIGTFVGAFTQDWEDLINLDTLNVAPYQANGKADFILSNRLAFEYDLRGPSTNVKTACSATAEAMHQAVLAIRAGSCPSAIVAGANLIMSPRGHIGMTSMGVLSPEGSCKTFDAKADGFARGESVTALFVKRLDHAIRDGNPVRAVIRACDANADGGGHGRNFGTPNPRMQEALIRQTYAAAGLNVWETGVVECHGTGTPVGDPLEVEAIANAFAGHELYIGSVKPNLGHGEGGSAAASIVKSVLALEQRTLMPNIKFDEPNPKICWSGDLKVPTEPTPWPAGVRERISVNSFGLGGSNVHIVLDSASSFGVTLRTARHHEGSENSLVSTGGKSLLMLSANSTGAIKTMAQDHEQYLAQHPRRQNAMAYTLAFRRERLNLGSYCVLKPSGISKPILPVPDQSIRRVAFVFTGQGAQWAGMGKDLFQEEPVFRETIRFLDGVLKSLKEKPEWTLEATFLAGTEDHHLLDPTERSQPASTALQIALVDLLASWNVRPAAVVGHSSGEVGAAYAAGVLTRTEAIVIAYYRGYGCTYCKLTGGMAAIGLGAEKVRPYLQAGVVIACENSDASVTISGDTVPLEEVMAGLREAYPGTLVRRLRVPMAYHSSHMKTVADLCDALMSPHLAPKDPIVPYFSTVHGKQLQDGGIFGSSYWLLNMQSPVLFRTAVSTMLRDMGSGIAHLEIGPHSALAGPLRQIYKETGLSAPYAPTQTRGEDSVVSFLGSMGKLFTFGLKPKPPRTGDCYTLPDLPTYPWHYDGGGYWSETRVVSQWRFRKVRRHELLGQRVLESSDIEPSWRNLIKLNEITWLSDHCVDGDVVFPAAAYVATAGEAAMQMGVSPDYTVQEVHIASALLLREGKPADIITTLRKKTLTNSLDSIWFHFTISSENNGTWTKHCSGLVTAGCVAPRPNANIETYSRKVNSQRWSAAMSRAGLQYGPRFVGLQDMTAHPVRRVASAVIDDQQDNERYALHPATIDLIFQSWAIASTNGETRKLTDLFLPTFIDEFYVGAASGKTIHTNMSASSESGQAQGDAFGVADGVVVFSMKGFRGTKIEGQAGSRGDGLKALTLQWHPDIKHANLRELIRPSRDTAVEMETIERFYTLCAAELGYQFATAMCAQPHLERWLSWLKKEVEQYRTRGSILVPDAPELLSLSRENRRQAIDACFEDSQGTAARPVIEILWRTYQNIPNILAGRISLLNVLLEDGLLARFYDWLNGLSDYQDFFAILGSNKPQLRVLEIGAGTGGSTARILEALRSQQGERLYQSYSVTDVSAGFFSQCKERLKSQESVQYDVLDISKDPLEQGFEAGAYDLIVASNVLHATPSLTDSLARCKKLLAPDGYLFIQEWSNTAKYADFIMGLFDAWWLGSTDGRSDRASVSPEECDIRLRKAGFGRTRAAVRDGASPYSNWVNIIAQPAVDELRAMSVTLLKLRASPSKFAQLVKEALKNSGHATEEYLLGEELPERQPIISLVDADPRGMPILAGIDAATLLRFVETISDAVESPVLWLMPPAQTGCANPDAGQMLGAARTIRAELGMDLATLELDAFDIKAANATVHVLEQLCTSRVEGEEFGAVGADYEYVWRDGRLLISRAHTLPVVSALTQQGSAGKAKHLTIGTRGMLSTLGWAASVEKSLDPFEVRLKMTAVGLNRLDLAMAMNSIDAVQAQGRGTNPLGSEGSGVITEVGSQVEHLAVGDRVATIGFETSVAATELTRPAALCVRIPDRLKDEDAAGMLIPYALVLWSFLNKAHLQKGQSVLIHSAAGGVGIAAIHVARWIGAEVYCTVSSQPKVDFLVGELGIPREHIFHSRDDSFLQGILKITNYKGVDVALNSLSGELLHATWKCIASGGCMLEIGKRDLLGRAQLAMHLFEDNRAYFGIDLARLTSSNQKAIGGLLSQIMRLYEDGQVHVVNPTTVFATEKVRDAFLHMQEGAHMGRMVVKMPASADELPVTTTIPDPMFREDATYLMIGGLGGLGRSVISWMAEHSAKHVVVISRSAGTRGSDKDFIHEMSEMDCSVECCSGDVADFEFLQKTIKSAPRPVAGVMHMAMVLKDKGFSNMDFDSWAQVIEPKQQGTWNLNRLLPQDLDFFILFGSVSGTLASYGQANYAAANAFLDAFVHFRHSQGLPAAVLDIAAVGEIGYVASTKEVAERLGRSVGRMISEQEFLLSLQLAVERSSQKYVVPEAAAKTMAYQDHGQIILHNEMNVALSDAQNQMPWKRDPRMAIFRNNEEAPEQRPEQGSGGLRKFLASLAAEPGKLDDPVTAQIFAEEIGKRVFAFIMKEDVEMDVTQTLAATGADSLVAIEMRNWWKQMFGTEITMLELNDASATLQSLGSLAVQRMKQKQVEKGGQ